MGIFDRIDWGSTRIDATVGDWTRSVSDWEPGMIEFAQYTTPSPWLGGEYEVATPLPGGRRFSFAVDSVLSGSPTSPTGAEFEEMDDLNLLFNPGSSSTVELKTQRKDAGNNTISRSILVRCVALLPYQVSVDMGGTGVVAKRLSGRIRYRVECYAPFPYWRDTTATSYTWSATAAGATQVAVNGGLACGARLTINSVTAAPSAVTLTSDANSYTAAESSTPSANEYFDANHADPTIIQSSGTWGAGNYIRVENGTQTFTGTTTGGGSSASVTLAFYPLWGSP